MRNASQRQATADGNGREQRVCSTSSGRTHLASVSVHANHLPQLNHTCCLGLGTMLLLVAACVEGAQSAGQPQHKHLAHA